MKLLKKHEGSHVRRLMNLAAAICFFAAALPASHAALPAYKTTVLQPLESDDWIAAYSLNDHGQSTGFSAVGVAWGRMNGVVWDSSGVPTLLPLPGAYARSSGQIITNDGHVLGSGDEANYDDPYSFVVRNGEAEDLALRAPGFRAVAMNASGQILGNHPGGIENALILNPDGSQTEIQGPVGSNRLDNLRINDEGTVAATVYFPYGDTAGMGMLSALSAGIWRDGHWTLLNDAHLVDFTNSNLVLAADFSQYPAASAIWDGEVLQTVPQQIIKMNEHGNMLGMYRYLGDKPFAKINGEDFLLNDLLDADLRATGWSVRSATSINNHDQILASAWDPVRGKFSAVLLSPVPEPATAAMMLVGLVGIAAGGVATRRS